MRWRSLLLLLVIVLLIVGSMGGSIFGWDAGTAQAFMSVCAGVLFALYQEVRKMEVDLRRMEIRERTREETTAERAFRMLGEAQGRAGASLPRGHNPDPPAGSSRPPAPPPPPPARDVTGASQPRPEPSEENQPLHPRLRQRRHIETPGSG